MAREHLKKAHLKTPKPQTTAKQCGAMGETVRFAGFEKCTSTIGREVGFVAKKTGSSEGCEQKKPGFKMMPSKSAVAASLILAQSSRSTLEWNTSIVMSGRAQQHEVMVVVWEGG
jgi:hypothetical protein